MSVDDSGCFGGGSDHNWIDLVLVDKFVKLVKVDTRPKKKNVWNIKDDQDWSAFQAAVVRNLPQEDVSGMSLDELASLVVSVLRNAGVSSIGYKRHLSKRSMFSRCLPASVVEALRKKRELGRLWKTLSSSVNPVPGEVHSCC